MIIHRRSTDPKINGAIAAAAAKFRITDVTKNMALYNAFLAVYEAGTKHENARHLEIKQQATKTRPTQTAST